MFVSRVLPRSWGARPPARGVQVPSLGGYGICLPLAVLQRHRPHSDLEVDRGPRLDVIARELIYTATALRAGACRSAERGADPQCASRREVFAGAAGVQRTWGRGSSASPTLWQATRLPECPHSHRERPSEDVGVDAEVGILSRRCRENSPIDWNGHRSPQRRSECTVSDGVLQANIAYFCRTLEDAKR